MTVGSTTLATARQVISNQEIAFLVVRWLALILAFMSPSRRAGCAVRATLSYLGTCLNASGLTVLSYSDHLTM